MVIVMITLAMSILTLVVGVVIVMIVEELSSVYRDG